MPRKAGVAGSLETLENVFRSLALFTDRSLNGWTVHRDGGTVLETVAGTMS
ncbi:hypothetical protein UVI_02024980 [Ustilaginoidea virens]|uniref:Uncharacterized protein n=1 Tax=Ustilaginoidea virens TaxID=1159556 RepID=A0A1B5KRV4_USTVR|nr:hypothetical protein UVI_02024980 [Ustilaginoidea virens]